MWDDDDGPPPPCEDDFEENEFEDIINMTQRDAPQRDSQSQADDFLNETQRDPDPDADLFDADLFDAEFENELELEREMRNTEGTFSLFFSFVLRLPGQPKCTKKQRMHLLWL
jgi:hypothetical protein